MSFEKEHVGVGEITNPLYKRVRDLDYLLSIVYPNGVPQGIKSVLTKDLLYDLLQVATSLRIAVAELSGLDDAKEFMRHYFVQRTQVKVNHVTALQMAQVRLLTKGSDTASFGLSSYKENEEFLKKYGELVNYAFYQLWLFRGYDVSLKKCKNEDEYCIYLKINSQSVSGFAMNLEEFRALPDFIRHDTSTLKRYIFYRLYTGLNHAASVKMSEKKLKKLLVNE